MKFRYEERDLGYSNVKMHLQLRVREIFLINLLFVAARLLFINSATSNKYLVEVTL